MKKYDLYNTQGTVYVLDTLICRSNSLLFRVCMQRMAPKLQNVTKVCDLIEVKIHMIENCTEQYSSAQDALLNDIFNHVRIVEIINNIY